MSKFRKKPIIIEAIQFTGSNATEIMQFMGHPVEAELSRVAIRTLEGIMVADPGDWVIRGFKGEFYPCKPDIFEATYEEVTE